MAYAFNAMLPIASLVSNPPILAPNVLPTTPKQTDHAYLVLLETVKNVHQSLMYAPHAWAATPWRIIYVSSVISQIAGTAHLTVCARNANRGSN